MVLLRVDFEPLAMKLQELLDKNGVVDIVCYQRVLGTDVEMPFKIIRVRKTNTQLEITQALLETVTPICQLVELKVN